MYRTNNPVADFERHDAEQEAMLERLPRCGYCDNPIQDDMAWEVNDEWYCDECFRYHHRKAVPTEW